MDDITGRESALYAISALNGTGVKEGIKWLFEKLSEKQNEYIYIKKRFKMLLLI